MSNTFTREELLMSNTEISTFTREELLRTWIKIKQMEIRRLASELHALLSQKEGSK